MFLCGMYISQQGYSECTSFSKFTGDPRPAAGFIDALDVALKQTDSSSGVWYAETRRLESVSLDACKMVRSYPRDHLRFTHNMPHRMRDSASYTSRSVLGLAHDHSTSRVPRFLPSSIFWALPGDSFSLRPDNKFFSLEAVRRVQFGDHTFHNATTIDSLATIDSLEALSFGDHFNESLVGVRWPPLLQRLHLGFFFNTEIKRVEWPGSLEWLAFGDSFDQCLEGVRWPDCLKRLTFGLRFNKPIERVALPKSLRRLAFGKSFNQRIDCVEWPVSLEELEFGSFFDMPVENARWPTSLRRLSFGDMFDKPMRGSALPASLQELSLGTTFDRVYDSILWPPALRQLTLGVQFHPFVQQFVWPARVIELTMASCEQYDTLVADDISFPPFLEGLTFGIDIDCVKGVRFPDNLRRLAFGLKFRGTIVDIVWPSCLEELTLGGHFDEALGGIVWPASLVRLTFGDYFSKRLEDACWGKSRLTHLKLGKAFNWPIETMTWPVTLKVLMFGECFTQDVSHVEWPDSLTELAFGKGYKKGIQDGTHWPNLQRLTLASTFATPFQALGEWCPDLRELTLLSDRRYWVDESMAELKWPPRLHKLNLKECWCEHVMCIPDNVDVAYCCPCEVEAGRS